MKSTDYKQKDSLRMNMTRNQLKSTVEAIDSHHYATSQTISKRDRKTENTPIEIQTLLVW